MSIAAGAERAIEIRRLFAEVTRYPLDVLDLDADLEDDLGIDSVKLGEIFAVIRERYRLPEKLEIPPERLKTIGGIGDALHAYLAQRAEATTPAQSEPAAAEAGDVADAPAPDAVRTAVRQVFAEVTRYPLDVLDLDADLEDDLGIDSVKLGEIFAVIRERYRLPEKLEIPPERLKTIGGIGDALHAYLAQRAEATTPAQSEPAAAEAGDVADAPAPDAVRTAVRQVFAEVTRYPLDVLDLDADLEDDLGIDSVKLGEIFAVIRERYRLPEKLDIPPERLKTIGGVGDALHAYLAQRAEATTPAQSEPAAAEAGDVADAPAPDAVRTAVRRVFAEVTRYPLDVLDLDADLEDDLGIDSVKLGEIFAVIRERYRLPEKLDIPPERLKTIGGVGDALHAYLAQRADATMPPNASPAAAALTTGAAPAATEPVAAEAATSRLADSLPRSFAMLTSEQRPFVGQVGFISGSGRALGKDIAIYLAELGATVIVNSFHSRGTGEETTELIRSCGGDAVHIWGSMANPRHLHRIFDEIEERYHRLDFFVSNASNGMLAPIEALTVEHWEKAFRTNVVGLHQGAVRAARLMKQRGGGKIITLSSPAAHGYVEYFGCMGPVKAAVEALTRALAIEFAPYGIQVNCVSPGPIDGELLRKWPESERLIDQWTAATPRRRLTEHREVSHFIAYLLSEPVSGFTGSTLVLDAGISAHGW